MRVAAIDIGTNTILMLIAEISQDGSISSLRDDHVIARLGKGVDRTGRITADTTDRVVGFLEKYKEIADSYHPDRTVACGTSALRDATNAAEVIAYLGRRVGLNIEVLSGHEEAELTYKGAVSEFLAEEGSKSFAVLDIGGGSSELTIGEGVTLTSTGSIDVGAVRLTERALLTSPPTPESVKKATGEVRSTIAAFPSLPPHTKLVGVAGTVTTLAAIELQLESYDPKLVSGHFLSLDSIIRLSDELKRLSVPEIIRKFPQIQTGRADVIYAGTMILVECLDHFGASGIIASDRGLRYGIALREVRRAEGNL
jgi:exopolyphosphatase/guanosine-5'-triphosphate,3'-diphosphate pyrophosphatase